MKSYGIGYECQLGPHPACIGYHAPMVSRGRKTATTVKKPLTSDANPHLEQLRKRVAQSPTGPGIYRWLDDTGTVLYVGKAKNLRKRLASYVQKNKKADGPWKQSFLTQIADVDVTVTNTELEALLLETNLIKQLRPKYNVLMKDDKNYLFVRISLDEPYPRVETIRRFAQDGAKYFGPFMNSFYVRETLDLLHEALGYRACKQSLDLLNRDDSDAARSKLRPCLEHQIGRCNGLCTGMMSKEHYGKRIDALISFFKGNEEPVKHALREKMQAAAQNKQFEKAAKFRNYLQVLEGKPDEQLATDASGEDSDIVGVAVLSSRAHVVILHRREGRLINESHFALQGQAESVASVLEQFLPQFYDDGQEVPPVVMLPADIDDTSVLHDLLKERRRGAVKLLVPERGRKSHVVQLAEKNALEKARQMEAKWEAEQRNTKDALEQLTDILELPALPKRIEGYDISHLGGTETVGSMVVMQNGKAANDQYRSFTIRSLKRGDVDDYRSIKEVLTRRIRRLTEDLPAEEKKWNEHGITFGKAVKKEQEVIERMTGVKDSYKDFICARQDSDIVGLGRLLKRPPNITELTSLWVREDMQESTLAQFIVRKILRGVKKGKVYVRINMQLEDQYARIGFRYVITPPKALSPSTGTIRPEAESDGEGGRGEGVMMWEAHQNKIDKSLTSRPDLIVIDGGKGQLSTAVSVLKNFNIDIPVIGLAKREEEVFKPGESSPTNFPSDSPAKFLLMRLRDEAHRFSNRHREMRAKTAMKASALDEMPGIGEETKRKLLKEFGSLSGVREASDADLRAMLTESQLEMLRAHDNLP